MVIADSLIVAFSAKISEADRCTSVILMADMISIALNAKNVHHKGSDQICLSHVVLCLGSVSLGFVQMMQRVNCIMKRMELIERRVDSLIIFTKADL